MKRILIFTLVLGLFACSGKSDDVPEADEFVTAEGVVTGGGGKGVLCGNQLQTLDMYEAKLLGYPDPVSVGTVEDNLKAYAMKVLLHFAYLIESEDFAHSPEYLAVILKYINENIITRFHDIPAHMRLPFTSDATLPSIPSNCRHVQIAVYNYSKGIIYRDLRYWNMLSPLEQAALIAHEFVYSKALSYGQVNSDETRQVISKIFTGQKTEPVLEEVRKASEWAWCGAGSENTDMEIFEIYALDDIQNGVQGVSLYFAALKSVYVSSRTSTFVPRLSIKDLAADNVKPFTAIVRNYMTQKTWNFEMGPGPNGMKLRATDNSGYIPPFSNAFCKIEHRGEN